MESFEAWRKKKKEEEAKKASSSPASSGSAAVSFDEYRRQKHGILPIQQEQTPATVAKKETVSPAILASSVPALSGPSYKTPLTSVQTSDPTVKKYTPDVQAEQQKREDVNNKIAVLMEEQNAAKREMDFYASSEYKGPQYLAAEQLYNQIQKQIREENQKAMGQQQIDEIKAYQETERWNSVKSREDYSEKSVYKKNDDLQYNVINRDPDAVAKSHEEAAKYNLDIAGVDMGYLEKMTDEEIGIYNYYYSTVGKEKADEYLASIEADLKARRMGERRDWYTEYAKQNPVAASAFSILTSPTRGLSYVGQAADYIKDGKLDANENYNIFTRASGDIRGQVSSDIEKNVEGFWGKAGSFAYNTGMSMGDFLMAAGLSGGVGSVATTIMGTGAAAQTVLDAKDRGLNDDQAFALGTIAGVAEAATEKFSVEALLDRTTLGKNAVTYILKNAITEGSEEAASGIINTVADVLISKDKSEWAQSVEGYKAQGMSKKEAFWKSVADQAKSIGLDALGGMLSGGLVGSVGAIGNAAVQKPKKGAEVATEMGIGKHGAEAAEQAGITPENVGAFTANYEAGKNGKAFEEVKTVQTGIDENVARRAFNAGQMDALAEGNTEQEVNENETGNESGSNGSERQIGMVASERSGSIQEGTGSAAERRETRRLRAEEIRRAVEASGQVSTSAAAQGIAEGTSNNTMKVVPAKLWTDEIRQMVHRQSAKGVQVIPFVGEMEMRDKSGTYTARGVVSRDGKRMWVCVDDLDVDYTQIEKHEDFHIAVKRDKKLLEKTRKAVVAKYTEEQLDQLVNMYVEAYGWGSLDEDYVLEEVLADAYAEIDTFEKTGMFEGATRFSGVVQESVSKSKATKNATRKGGIKTSRGIQRTQAEITTDYQQTVDDILGGRKVVDGAVVMGYTPKLYQEMGMPSIPFVIGSGHIYSIAKTEAEARRENKPIKGKHYHGLGDAAVKNLYEKVKNPVAIISAKDLGQNAKRLRSAHSIVAIVDLGTIDNSLLVPVEITAERTVNGQRMDVNVISTAYERDVRRLMDEAIAQENAGQIGIFYAKKEAASLIGAGVQFPKLRQATTASEGIVRSFSEKVNMNVVDQTQSLQFKDWFGDWQNNPQKASKVVDENGEPLVVYHGTGAMFDAFDNAFTGQGNDQYGSGFYFTTDPSTSERYKSSEDGQVVPAFLNIRKPIVLNAAETSSLYDVEISARDAAKIIALAPDIMDSENSVLGDFFDEYWEVGPKKYMINQLANQYDWTFGSLSTDIFRDYPTEFREAVNKALGYDGVEVDFESGEKHFVAWFPNQIKHATENTGEFSRTDDRFRRSRGLTQEQLDAFIEKYGAIEPGENPFRTVQVPKKTSETEKVSYTARTAMEAEATPADFVPLIENEIVKGGFSFVPVSNDETTKKAKGFILGEGWQSAWNKWSADVKMGKAGNETIAIGALLYNHAVNAGNYKAALDILTDYQVAVRNSARGLQAARILKKLSPDARLYMINKDIQKLVEELKLDEPIELPQSLVDQYMKAKSNKEVDNAVGDIQEYVAAQIPSTGIDMWTALRYTNMLGNFKTQVRNVAGNIGMRLVSEVENAAALAVEKLAGGKLGRTRALFVDKQLRQLAKDDFANVRAEAMGETRYTLDNATASSFLKGVQDKKTVFKRDIKVFGKDMTLPKVFNAAIVPMEYYRKATNWAMNNAKFGDEGFTKSAYARALGEYLKANGVTAEQFGSEEWQQKHGDFLDKARQYAVARAQELTFRDHNAFSNAIASMGRKPTSGKWTKVLSEGVLPFRRTPANVLVRAEEYSPLGLINTAIKAAQLAKGKENVTGNDVVNSLAKTITGTGIFLVGMAMHNMGLLRGGDDEDEKVARMDDLMGHQTYALEIGGISYTLDWLTPTAMPLFMGAQLNKLIEDGGFELKDIYDAMVSLVDPMLQMSMLSGLNDTLDNIRYIQGNGLLQIALNAGIDYLTQGLTNSLMGQLDRTLKDVSEMTFVDSQGDVPTFLQKELGAASRKVPVWDYSQIPYIDAWGRTESSGSVPGRILKNFLSPGYVSDIGGGDLEDEILELYQMTGDGGVFPSTADKHFPVKGEEVYLNADDYVRYATQKGQLSYEIAEKIMKSSVYRGMSDEEKAEAISDAYSLANVIAKKSVSKYETEGWKEKAVAAKKIGIDYSKYLEVRLSVKDVESLKNADGDTISSSKGLQIMEAIYNIKGLNDKQRLQLFEDFGVGKSIINLNKAAVEAKLKNMR